MNLLLKVLKKKSSMVSITFKTNTLNVSTPMTVFIVSFVLVSIYSALPALVHSYNFPPGNDPYHYLTMLDDFPNAAKYYGILPARYLGLNTYYYLTPLLVFVGLYVTLKNLSPYAPITAWIVLFFMTSVILQDLEAGTFVGVIGFYLITLATLKYVTSDSSDKRVTVLLITLALAFHTVAGVLCSIAYVGTCLRRPKFLLLLIPTIILAIVMAATKA